MAPTLPAANNCAACDRPDSVDDFVQCDSCDKWWHFSCAGVSESISDRAWVCVTCRDSDHNPKEKIDELEADPKTPTMQQVSVNEIDERNNQQQSVSESALSRLKERQELVLQRIEIELQKKFLEDQQRLMDDLIAEEERKSQPGAGEQTDRVQDWIRNSADDEAGAVGGKVNLHGAEHIEQRI